MALRAEDVVSVPEAIADVRLRVVRRAVSLQHAVLNVFVPLVDDHMVDEASRRHDLLEIAPAAAEFQLLYAHALDASLSGSPRVR
jgi:hypothetical protein